MFWLEGQTQISPSTGAKDSDLSLWFVYVSCNNCSMIQVYIHPHYVANAYKVKDGELITFWVKKAEVKVSSAGCIQGSIAQKAENQW